MSQNKKNVAHSLFQRLLNRDKTNKEDFNLLLSRYGLERFLYRLSVSPHNDRFVLKGAKQDDLRKMLMWVIVEIRSMVAGKCKKNMLIEPHCHTKEHSPCSEIAHALKWFSSLPLTHLKHSESLSHYLMQSNF